MNEFERIEELEVIRGRLLLMVDIENDSLCEANMYEMFENLLIERIKELEKWVKDIVIVVVKAVMK